ncbi:DUF4403 family protein [Geobacter sp. FeAm09]|uniref:DUF4403 family protein n=1 Tax=Geobacter sp. FeAm09 TaxID=2597769 RepID=UPI001F118887|nr:DUF4403 family protein [Geobacter sp. FeAm09]
MLSSCAGVTTLTAGPPRAEAFRSVLSKEVSTLNLPIEATTTELAAVLNRTVPKELYRGATRTSGLTADVVRNGPIAVTAADNYLYVTLPVAMSLSYGMFETPAVPLTLRFKATAGITPDWRLHAEISYQGLSDLLAEEVGIGPLSLKPRSIVEGITQPLQRVLSDLVTRKINELIPLKAQVAKVWNSARQPVPLDKNRSVWLKLTPHEVVMCPLSARDNRVKLSVGISTCAELVVGPEPAAQALPPLPSLKLVTTFDRTFRIALNADIFYKELRVIAAPLLLNKPFDSDGERIVVRGFDLYGNGDRLVIRLETQGALEGVFYLTAKPVYDPKTGIFSVEDVDFDMQTRSLLLQSADWFLHGAIRSVIQDKLNMNLNRQVEQSRQVAGKALARVPLMDRVFLRGDIKGLKFGDVIVQRDKISLQVYTEGESAIIFQ